jgi:hypothetical protein
MLLASSGLSIAASPRLFRWIGLPEDGALAALGLFIGLIAAFLVHDLVERRRLFAATEVGGGFAGCWPTPGPSPPPSRSMRRSLAA